MHYYLKFMKAVSTLIICFFAPALFAQTISGKVSCDGKGIKDVVVTDGIHFAQTDHKGEYIIPMTDNASFVYLSTPAGYLPQREYSMPLFYQPIQTGKVTGYDFELKRNPYDDNTHTFMVHADAQLFKKDNLQPYNLILDDCIDFIETKKGKEIFGIDCGDLVGDKPELYPDYIRSLNRLDIPFYRVIGNHDMTLYGRSHETSYRKFEEIFGPSYYSFNKGKAHYIVLNDVFYLARDYFYAGYIEEKLFSWLEKDLSYIKEGSLVFVAMHIPSRLEVGQIPFEYSNANIAGRVSNAAFLYEILKPYRAHLLTGHTHYNRNIEHSEQLFEHITAAVCGTWWQGTVCLDGTPQGYGVYEVDNDHVTWYFKSAGFPKEYQMRTYAPGSSIEYPDDVIANIWNWDVKWKVQWLENGKMMGEMIRFSMCDPAAEALCADKEKLEFKWISATPNEHMFRATVKDKNAKIEVIATDRFGNIYRANLNNNK